MKSNDIVSIIITTYGGKECIVNAIKSCLKQTYSKIEIIVVDDNGENTCNQIKTEKLLKEYIDSQKIVYIKHKNNFNASVARNTGVKNAKGSYIALLDDDDIFSEKKIEEQIKAFKNLNESYGIVYCGMLDYVGNKVYEYKATYNGYALYDFLMMKVGACTSNIMIKKSDYINFGGFDESFERHQDWEFISKILRTKKIYGIDYLGTIKNTKIITKRFKAEIAEEYRLKYIEFIKTLLYEMSYKKQRDIIAHEYCEIAKLFFREKNIKKTLYYIKKSKRPVTFFCSLLLKPIKELKNKTQLLVNKKIIENK